MSKSEWSKKYALPDGTMVSKEAEDRIDKRTRELRMEEMKKSISKAKVSGDFSAGEKQRLEEKRKKHEEEQKKIEKIRQMINSGKQDIPISTLRDLEQKEKDNEIKIPRGWTYLKHGTNFVNWFGTDIMNADQIVIKKPMSAITKEAWERDASMSGEYDTTAGYSNKIYRPKEMSDEQFAKLNKPFEIRVLFYKDHIRRKTADPEYAETLDDKTKDLIDVYYLKNIQHGRHELIPKNEILIKLDHKIENGVDVFYFVPLSVVDAYEKESGIKINRKI